MAIPALRVPYNPPPRRPLVVRSISYGNEQHPVSAKKTVTVPLLALPLMTPDSIHKFIVLAGVHWSPEPPKNSGIGTDEVISPLGYFRLSCERYPDGAMNLNWIMKTIDRLVKESNVSHSVSLPKRANINALIGFLW
jgi:small subunit ribosomal protein S35